MGKRRPREAASGSDSRDRHRKRLRNEELLKNGPAALEPRPEVHLNSKHHSYYEIVDNADKKKKLEFTITGARTPPPGFEFVPIGNPELTHACKEISREQDAMIFIVSSKAESHSLSQQTNRIGHHIRQAIVEQAREQVDDNGDSGVYGDPWGRPEPIPDSQEEINQQADKVMRDLFPRIPNTDRQIIIEHSFKKGVMKKGAPLVGLAPDIPLTRRVQLAVLAHIRHTHTRYDKLLKETTYVNARRAVQSLCLDVLVKWRGDEENGRDQLDEILREVIVISDSEGEDSDDDEDSETDSSDVESTDATGEPSRSQVSLERRRMPISHHLHAQLEPADGVRYSPAPTPYVQWYDGEYVRPTQPVYLSSYGDGSAGSKRARRGFKRYQAALTRRWDEARDRVRLQGDQPLVESVSAAEPQPPIYHVAYDDPMQQEQMPIPPPFYTGSGHDTLHRRGPHSGNAQSLDLSGRSRVATVPYTASPRSLSDDFSRGNSPYADPHHRLPSHRVIVRADEARDLLVPSVEPLSPSVPDHQPPSLGPVFVRPVTPRYTSQALAVARQEVSGYDPGHVSAPHSPSWAGNLQGPYRGRQDENEGPRYRGSPFAEPGQYRQQPRGEQDRLAAQHVGEPVNAVHARIVREEGLRAEYPIAPAQRMADAPPSRLPAQAYSSHGAEIPLRDTHNVTVIYEERSRPLPQMEIAYPVNDHPRTTFPGQQMPQMVQVGDARYPQAVGERQAAPIRQYGSSGLRDELPYRDYQAPHDARAFHPAQRLERSEGYGHQALYGHAVETQPREYHPSPPGYPAPHSDQHGYHQEAAPVFVRPVERHEQTHMAWDSGRSDPQNGARAMPGPHLPRQVHGAWPQPQERDGGPPYGVPQDNPPHRVVYVDEHYQRPPNDQTYHSYEDYESGRYGQQGR